MKQIHANILFGVTCVANPLVMVAYSALIFLVFPHLIFLIVFNAIYSISFFAMYFFCGYLSRGYTLAYYQYNFPSLAEKNYLEDLKHAKRDFKHGVIGLSVAFEMGHTRYGRLYEKPVEFHKKVNEIIESDVSVRSRLETLKESYVKNND